MNRVAIERHHAAMVRLERDYQGGLRSAMVDARREVGAALMRKTSPVVAVGAVLGSIALEATRQTYIIKPKILAQAQGFAAVQAKPLGFVSVPVGIGIDGLALLDNPAWLASAGAQLQFQAIRLIGADPSLAYDRLVGEAAVDGRTSEWDKAMTSMDLGSALGFWAAGNAVLGDIYDFFGQTTQQVIRRQAVAAIDQYTTDCCLQVHGQIVGLDQPFKLDGEPRFADELIDPPFHWKCRTSVTLWTESLELSGVTTEDMTSASQAELDARASTGERQRIWPSHATSGRANTGG